MSDTCRNSTAIEQSCIVSIFDKFDALTNSISQGLPREIALGKAGILHEISKPLAYNGIVN